MNTLGVKKVTELTSIGTDNQWLIENLLPKNCLALLSAPPKHGKSMIALDLLTSVSSGANALGKFSVKMIGRCLYVAIEDTEKIIKNRVELFANAKGVDAKNLELYVYADQSLLIDTDLGKQKFEAMLTSFKPTFVVLDNLSRIHSSNENSAQVMQTIFEYLQGIKRQFGLTLMVICHSGKDSKIRGSSQIDSYYEAGIFLRSNGSGMLMDLTYRGYPSVKDIPYRINDNNNGIAIDIGSTVVEHCAKEQQKVFDIPTLIANGVLEEFQPGLIRIKK